MRKLLLITLILFAFNASAQIFNDSIITFVANWRANEIRHYRVFNMKLDIWEGDTTIIDDFNYDVKFEVLEKKNDGYKIRWTPSNFYFATTNDSLKNRFLSITNSINFMYEADITGAFKQITNLTEVQKMIGQAILLIKMEYGNKPEVERLVAQTQAKYGSMEALRAFGLSEILQFHAPLGVSLEADTVYKTKVSMPNIYGGKPFMADSDFYIAHVDEVSHTAVVHNILTVDPKEATLASFEHLKKMAQRNGHEEPYLHEMPIVSITHRMASNMFIDQGRLMTSVFMREIKLGSQKTSIDKTNISTRF
jgi:hypothetical protein